jgi:hypothetical protein
MRRRDSCECPNCGCDVDRNDRGKCPKCHFEVYSFDFLEVDIAHSGERWLEAKHKILTALGDALFLGFKGLKLIHGYGSQPGHTSSIRRNTLEFLKWIENQYVATVRADHSNPGVHFVVLDEKTPIC